jgi:protein-tyrosine sulfotransferase
MASHATLGHRAKKVLAFWKDALLVASWRSRPYMSEARPIIIGGCGRSGTTLLRVILDTHPDICCGPESNLFLPRPPSPRLPARFGLGADTIERLLLTTRSQGEFVDRFFELYSRSRGKPRWAEKTPRNVRYIPFIFEHFPNARFLHMIRDGRDTICSLRTHPSRVVVDGRLTKVDTWNPIEWGIRRWVHDVEAGLRFRDDPRYMEVRYEDLILKPRETLVQVCEFIQEPFVDSLVEFYKVQDRSRDSRHFAPSVGATVPLYAESIGRWRRELNARDVATTKRIAGSLLIQLQYVPDLDW